MTASVHILRAVDRALIWSRWMRPCFREKGALDARMTMLQGALERAHTATEGYRRTDALEDARKHLDAIRTYATETEFAVVQAIEEAAREHVRAGLTASLATLGADHG